MHLDDYLDRELSPREIQLVERHLRICHHCTQVFAFEGTFLRDLKDKVQRVETDATQIISMLERIKAALPDENSK